MEETRYITSRALSSGILKVVGEVLHGKYFSANKSFRGGRGSFDVFVSLKRDHPTVEAAQVEAQMMLEKKIEHAEKALAALKKALAALKNKRGKPFKVLEQPGKVKE